MSGFDERVVAGELVRVARELVGGVKKAARGPVAADAAVYEVVDEVGDLRKQLSSYLKNFGLERDRHSRAALKALADAESHMRQIPDRG